MSSDRANLGPADELQVVRAKIKRLHEREQQLRDILLEDEEARSGQNVIAEVKTTKRSNFSKKAAEEAGLDLSPFTKTTESQTIVIHPRVSEHE